MKFETPLIPGKLIKRYKRFLADIELDTGEIITAHCPNSGSMKGINTPGAPVMVQYVPSPTRKLKYTWELIHNGLCWVGLNTIRANRIVEEAIRGKSIKELRKFDQLFREKKYGINSKIDFLMTDDGRSIYVEVKNVTLVEGRTAMFPDAVTTRGQKHMQELAQMVQEGHRAVVLFLIQREDADGFRPADSIDPEYSRLLREAVTAGVEILPYQCKVSTTEIIIHRKLPAFL
ncbi:MAG: DNA/RNA nuclease SfsA [Calditrichia bacterium]